MPLSTPIPSDVIRIIIGNLKGNEADLKNTALVSSMFLEPSQAHLFAFVSLTVRYSINIKKHPIKRLLSAFDSNPDLASHIRELKLEVHNEPLYEVKFPQKNYISDHIVVPVLRMIRRLESFILDIQWERQTDTLKSAILDMCRTKSLSHINLFHCPGFPIVHLSCLHHLRHLTILKGNFADFTNDEIETLRNEVEASPGGLEILELNGFGNYITTPQPLYKTLTHPCSLLNVSKLRVLNVLSTMQNSTEDAWKMMRLAASNLECLHWHLFDRGYGTFDHPPVDFALLPELRILSLSITVRGLEESHIPNTWVVESLQQMAGRNILECLALMPYLDFMNPQVKPTVEALLRWLDLLLTGGEFPHLTQLKIFLGTHEGGSERREVVMRSFPRSKAAGILSVDHDYPLDRHKHLDLDFISRAWKHNYRGG